MTASVMDFCDAVSHTVLRAPEEHPALLSNVPLNPKTSRELMTQSVCETVQRARHARGDAGRIVSVCFEAHDGPRDGPLRRWCRTHEGYAVPRAITRYPSASLSAYLTERGYSFVTIKERVLVHMSRRKCATLLLDFNTKLMHLPQLLPNQGPRFRLHLNSVAFDVRCAALFGGSTFPLN